MSVGRALTRYVGVIGVGDVPADGELAQTAYAVGRALAGRGADAVVAIGGGWGTLSEIALAVRAGVPVVGLHTWEPVPPGAHTGPVEALADPVAAADRAFELAAARRSRRQELTGRYLRRDLR